MEVVYRSKVGTTGVQDKKRWSYTNLEVLSYKKFQMKFCGEAFFGMSSFETSKEVTQGIKFHKTLNLVCSSEYMKINTLVIWWFFLWTLTLISLLIGCFSIIIIIRIITILENCSWRELVNPVFLSLFILELQSQLIYRYTHSLH